LSWLKVNLAVRSASALPQLFPSGDLKSVHTDRTPPGFLPGVFLAPGLAAFQA
jgi:hypothetical protein